MFAPFASELPLELRAWAGWYFTLNMVLESLAPACFLEVEHKLVDLAVFAILLASHGASMINVNLPNDKIVHVCSWPVGGVPFVPLVESEVRQAKAGDLERCAPEGSLAVGVGPILVSVIIALTVQCRDRRVVTHLLS